MADGVSSQSIEFNYSALDSVSCGEPVAARLAQQVDKLDARRVLLVASATLRDKTEQFA